MLRFNGPHGAGTTTSGGTESILMACKTYRDWARQVKGITRPEMCVGSPLALCGVAYDLGRALQIAQRARLTMQGDTRFCPRGVLEGIAVLWHQAACRAGGREEQEGRCEADEAGNVSRVSRIVMCISCVC